MPLMVSQMLQAQLKHSKLRTGDIKRLKPEDARSIDQQRRLLQGQSVPLEATFNVNREVFRGRRVRMQYDHDGFDVAILLPGWNRTSLVGPNPLQDCILLIPPALLQQRGCMAAKNEAATALTHSAVSFITSSFPFPGSELAIIPPHAKQLQQQRWQW